MEQQIRYCTTSDGVRIAYAIVGKGPPVVRVVGWFSHLEYELKSQYWRPVLEVAASQHLYVRYDGRGMGLSDRQVSDLSLEAHVRDLEAVIDSAGIERFGLDGISQGGPTAIAYAVRHPERVTHLVLYGSYARLKPAGLDLDTDEGRGQFDAMLTLMRHGWGSDTPAFRQMFTGLFMPDADGDSIREFNEMQRTSTSAETAATLFAEMVKVDVTDLLTKVSVPTLVLHRKGDAIVPFELGRQLATAIPGARFLPVEGNNHAVLPHEPELLAMGVEIENFIQGVVAAEEERQQSASIESQAQSPSEGDLVGKVVSHYKILEKLGEGGMGVVYKAEDTKLERPVALKFLSPSSLGTEEEKVRFIREAKTAAILDHPNICTVYEVDEAASNTFISMAYLDGQSLADKIESDPLDINEAIKIALRVAEGLKHAHKRGIVHRDIKPANIMITEDGQAKIMDFGLAKLSGKTRLTKTATVMGTIAYMSPEQARGDKDIDRQTDIWSLGVMLYEMLSGKLPFDAETDTGLIYKIVNEGPEPIRNHQSDIPSSLVSIIEKTMQKDPQSRYQDSEELIADLEAVKSESTVSADKRSPSIAVLPFVNMSADPEQEYFCDGLAEDLINALTKLQHLRVIARTSAFSFKGQDLDVREIGRKLNVGAALEGSVRKAGNRLRITAQLVDTAGGHHLWSEQYNREMDDVFAIQDEITMAIVDSLKPRLLGGEKARLVKHQTVDIEAYNLYLKGRWFWNKRTGESIIKAFDLFEQAIEKDPTYAPAYAGLVECYVPLTLYGPVAPKDILPKAKEVILKALSIDDSLSETHAALANLKMFYEWDWGGAERGYERAIEINPGNANAHHFKALCLMYMARFDEAIGEIEKARDLDPLSLFTNRNIGTILYYAGRYDQAIKQCKRVIEMDQNFPLAHGVLAGSYAAKGMYEDALAELRKEADISPNMRPLIEAMIGWIHTRMGKREEAQRALDELLLLSEQIYVPPYFIARTYFNADDKDRGFEYLDKAYEACDIWLCYLKIDPLLDDVISDPRYKEMLKKIGLDK